MRMELIHPLSHTHRAGAPVPSCGALEGHPGQPHVLLPQLRKPPGGRSTHAVPGCLPETQHASGKKQLTAPGARLACENLVSTQLGFRGEGSRTRGERAAAGKRRRPRLTHGEVHWTQHCSHSATGTLEEPLASEDRDG